MGVLATPTGLEPATSAVTGRRANQLRYGAKHGRIREAYYSSTQGCWPNRYLRTPNGVRTRVTALKGRRPRPLDDGGSRNPVCTGPLGTHESIREAPAGTAGWSDQWVDSTGSLGCGGLAGSHLKATIAPMNALNEATKVAEWSAFT